MLILFIVGIIIFVIVAHIVRVAWKLMHDPLYRSFGIILQGNYKYSNHGDTIEDFIQNVRGEQYEYFALFRRKRKLFEVTSFERGKVGVTSMLIPERYTQLVCVHNHPPADATFTLDDIKTFCVLPGLQKAIVVGKSAVHTLSAPLGWPDVNEVIAYSADEYGIDISGYFSTNIPSMVLQRLIDKGYIKHDEDADTSGVYVLLPKLIEELADHFKLTYTITEL